MDANLERQRDWEELSRLRHENAKLKTVLSTWVEMSKDGALCCGCNSGPGSHCSECGIKDTEKLSKKLLKRKKVGGL